MTSPPTIFLLNLFSFTTDRTVLSSFRADFRSGFSAPTPFVRLRAHDVVLIRSLSLFQFPYTTLVNHYR